MKKLKFQTYLILTSSLLLLSCSASNAISDASEDLSKYQISESQFNDAFDATKVGKYKATTKEELGLGQIVSYDLNYIESDVLSGVEIDAKSYFACIDGNYTSYRLQNGIVDQFASSEAAFNGMRAKPFKNCMPSSYSLLSFDASKKGYNSQDFGSFKNAFYIFEEGKLIHFEGDYTYSLGSEKVSVDFEYPSDLTITLPLYQDAHQVSQSQYESALSINAFLNVSIQKEVTCIDKEGKSTSTSERESYAEDGKLYERIWSIDSDLTTYHVYIDNTNKPYHKYVQNIYGSYDKSETEESSLPSGLSSLLSKVAYSSLTYDSTNYVYMGKNIKVSEEEYLEVRFYFTKGQLKKSIIKLVDEEGSTYTYDYVYMMYGEVSITLPQI